MDLIYTEILLYLDYQDIINACEALPIFSNVCNGSYFWSLKAKQDFGIPLDELPLFPGKNNKERYRLIYNTKSPNEALTKGVNMNNLALVKFAIKKGANLHIDDERALK